MSRTAGDTTPLLHKPAMPSQIRLYYELNRLHKFPAGIILVFWPCAWALTMAAYRTSLSPAEFLRYLVVYAFSSTLVHSAACVLNDICDRDLDRRVERTMNRPLACGAISLRGAVICLLAEVSICIAVLGATGNLFTFLIGFLGIFPLHGLYPLMKRVTFWPQAWLGLAMNWGYIVVWIHHVKEDTYTIPAIFFLGTVCWTIVYDTIYGCQDRVDDVKAGVKSTSLLFGNHVRPILAIFATAFLVAMACAGYLNHQKRGYYAITVGGTALHLAWQLVTLKENEPADCWRKFQSNGTLGFIAFIGMAVDYVNVVW